MLRLYLRIQPLKAATLRNSSTVVNERLMKFLMFEVFQIDKTITSSNPKYHHVNSDIVVESLSIARKISEDFYYPHYKKSDIKEPKYNPDGSVEIIPEVAKAMNAFRDAGFYGAHADFEYGGMQLPFTVTMALLFPFLAANPGTCGYSFLTISASNMLRAVGTKDQLDRYLTPMIQGRFTGTMNLSEPQAGSSLGDITTKATRRSDGKFNIKGTKMWISAGEHNLAENIVHMVLAKVDSTGSGGTAAGVKGISLFIVPKYRLNDDGSVGAHNDITLMGLNHKMGYRGTTNCVLSYGERGDCEGELLGREGEGLATMFLMMNEARVIIGLSAVALGYSGYMHSLAYARDRTQGRPLASKDPSSPQTAIINHSDVRRMLLLQKAYVDGSLALCMYGATLVDTLHDQGLPLQQREDTQLLLDLLTPILKSWPSEWCLEANKWAIQIHGGYGYTRDFIVEQIYRDNRLNMIHEGTNGIQSLDLLLRKIPAKSGRGVVVLGQAIAGTISSGRELCGDPVTNASSLQSALLSHCDDLQAAVATLTLTVQRLSRAKAEVGVNRMASNSHELLNMCGNICIAWQLLNTEITSVRMLLANDKPSKPDQDFLMGNVYSSRYFFTYDLPKVRLQAEVVQRCDDIYETIDDNYF